VSGHPYETPNDLFASSTPLPAQSPALPTASMQAIMEQLDYRDKAAQAYAKKIIRNWVLAALGIVGAPVSALGFMQQSTVEATPRMEARIDKLEQIIRDDSNRIRQDLRSIAWVVLDMQSQAVDSAAYLGNKLDKVSKRAQAVRLPERESRKAVDQRLDKLLGAPARR